MNDHAVTAIRERLAERGLSAYVACTPSNIFYVTGFNSYFVSEWWRMHGTVFAVVPAAVDAPVTLVVSDFEAAVARGAAPDARLLTYRLWVELREAAELRDGQQLAGGRPEQYDEDELDRVVTEALRSAGTGAGPIACDRRHVSVDTLERLTRCAPGAPWVDFTEELYAVRAVKQPWEVERLRRAVELSEHGMQYAAARLAPGVTAHDVRLMYQIGVAEAALADRRYSGLTDSWVLPTVGGRTAAAYGDAAGGLTRGQLVKFDCGATVDGYRCDGGRTYAFGEPSPQARQLYDVVAEAQRRARAALRPGVPLADVFAAAMDHVHAQGFPAYTRGHVGHSVGIDTFHEEPPFISPVAKATAEEGMVFAVEVPTYTPDVGAIMIEDLVLVTAEGAECLHRLPHELTVVATPTG